jgi:SOS-response transcriptional repressor LexA
MSTSRQQAAGLGLSRGQYRTLKAICAYVRLYGRSPSLRELGKALEIKSTNGVSGHLEALERKGWISRPSGGPGGYSLARVITLAGVRTGIDFDQTPHGEALRAMFAEVDREAQERGV